MSSVRLLVVLVVAVLVSAGCLSLPASGPDATTSAELTVTVTEVVDGDTLKFRYGNGSTDTARLLGVDTPEIFSANEPGEYEGVPDTDAGVSCLREWGHEAAAFARDRLTGEQIELTFDANEPRRGKYGRLLVYVHHDGSLFNRELVERGLARVYDSNFEKGEQFYALESTAQDERRGLWGCRIGRTPTPGDEVRLAVVEVHADAAGIDNENLNDELVVFRNRGDEPLSLSEWRVTDAAGHEYVFPDGFTLAAGGTVTLYTGTGTDTEGNTSEGVSDAVLYWGATSAIWNNGGDTITVYDETGGVAVERTYS